MLLKINGGRQLSGEIKLQGSKNGALALLAGVIITRQKMRITNVPKIEDIINFLSLAKLINVDWYFLDKDLFIDASNLLSSELDKQLIHSLRASIYFLSILSSISDSFSFYSPGGCNLGARPINFHLDLLTLAGGNHSEKEGKISINFPSKKSFTYSFPQRSVGGTINALLLASTIEGVSTIENCAEEVEVKQLVDFLLMAGVDITELNGAYIVKGTKTYKKVESFINKTDRIVAASYLAMGLLSAKSLTIHDVPLLDISDFLEVLDYANLKYEIIGKDSIRVYEQDNEAKLKLTCQPWPGLSSDTLPIIVALFIKGNNLGLFSDEVYPLRIRYLSELEKLGLCYTISDKHILVRGSEKLYPAKINCTDLRGGMSMVLAALTIKGTTIIENAELLLRGYENLFEILKELGADVEYCYEK